VFLAPVRELDRAVNHLWHQRADWAYSWHFFARSTSGWHIYDSPHRLFTWTFPVEGLGTNNVFIVARNTSAHSRRRRLSQLSHEPDSRLTSFHCINDLACQIQEESYKFQHGNTYEGCFDDKNLDKKKIFSQYRSFLAFVLKLLHYSVSNSLNFHVIILLARKHEVHRIHLVLMCSDVICRCTAPTNISISRWSNVKLLSLFGGRLLKLCEPDYKIKSSVAFLTLDWLNISSQFDAQTIILCHATSSHRVGLFYIWWSTNSAVSFPLSFQVMQSQQRQPAFSWLHGPHNTKKHGVVADVISHWLTQPAFHAFICLAGRPIESRIAYSH
jgi:hypothetical protein